MTGTLHFSLFGMPEITNNGEPLNGFISSKAQALLYYLVATAQPQSRDHLATLFWGEMPTATARKNLTKALSNLRKLVGNVLVTDRQRALVNMSKVGSIDLVTFQSLLEDPNSTPIESIQQASALYRGPFLDNVVVNNAPDFEIWLMAMREQLQRTLLHALEETADQLHYANRLELALTLTERVLELNPIYEPAHRRKMTLLTQLGKEQEALAHYDTNRQRLATEFALSPEPATVTLYEEIKEESQTTATPPPHNLPATLTSFVGREQELIALVALLNTPECRLLTITGAGGIGKTRLALQLATQFIQPTSVTTVPHPYRHGIYLVPLTSLNGVDSIIAMLADVLGFTFYEEGDSRQQLLDALHNRRMLLVLDNVEHLITEPLHAAPVNQQSLPSPTALHLIHLVRDILAESPNINLVMTSRTRLNMEGEQLFSLAGLRYPQGLAEQLTTNEFPPVEDEYSAIQLFVQSARRLQPEFVLLEQDWPAVVRICQLVQGMPLGILLAAAWMDVFSPNEIADEISRNLDFLEADLPDLPSRQRSIRAAIDHSWRMLVPHEQELFQKLAIFRGSFSRHAAQQIANASPRLLQALVKKSLLQPVVQGRFVLHELLRQYGEERLAQTSELATAIRDRHSAYFATATAAWTLALKDERQQQTLLAMEKDGENLLVAWQWLVAQEELEHQLAMINGLCQFYVWRGRYEEGAATVLEALQRLPFAKPRANAAMAIRLHGLLSIWHSLFQRLLGNRAQAQQQLISAISQLRAVPSPEEDLRAEQAFALLQLGETQRDTDRANAQRCYEESLALYRAIGDQWGAANALAALGWLIQHLGAYDEARYWYQESLEIRQALRDQQGIAGCLRDLGGIILYQGHHAEAERLIRQSITLYSEMDDQAGIAAGLGKLGETLTLLGRADEAVEPLEESAKRYHTLGLQDAEMFIRAVLGHTMLHLGNYTIAHRYAQIADEHFQAIHSQRGIAYTQLIRGWALLAQGNQHEADELLRTSATIYTTIGQLDELGQAQALLGISAYQQGDLVEAAAFYQQARETAHAIQAFMPLTLADSLSTLLLYSSQPKQHTQVIANDDNQNENQLAAHPLVTNSRWFATLLNPNF